MEDRGGQEGLPYREQTSDTKPRVFVTHDTGDDLEELESQFGELVYLSSGYVDMNRTAFVEALRTRIKKRVAESKPYDYVFFQGFALVSALTVREWFLLHNNLNLIVRRRRDNRFIVVGLT